MKALRLVLGIMFGICGLLFVVYVTREREARTKPKPKTPQEIFERWKQGFEGMFPTMPESSNDKPMTIYEFFREYGTFGTMELMETHTVDLRDPIEIVGQRVGKSSFAAMEMQELMQ